MKKKSSPEEKLDKLSEILGFNTDKGKRPFQTFKLVFDFRNDIVHAKTVKLEETSTFPIDKFLQADELPPLPLTKWETTLNTKNATRFFEDSQKMIAFLYKESGFGDDPFEEVYSRTTFEGNL